MKRKLSKSLKWGTRFANLPSSSATACRPIEVSYYTPGCEFPSNESQLGSIFGGVKSREAEITKYKVKEERNFKGKESKRYGRWTEEEHRKLMEALELYGNAWLLVEKHIGTRTSNQIRSHVQKHFLKVKKEQLSEMERRGELAQNLFVVTREYRNNARVGMQEYKKIKQEKKRNLNDLKSQCQEVSSTSDSEIPADDKANEFAAYHNEVIPSIKLEPELVWEQECAEIIDEYESVLKLDSELFEAEPIEIMGLKGPGEVDFSCERPKGLNSEYSEYLI
eukprot:TRINITY_DN3059_c0_g1_i5.p1 TRINITY_DN3059_c0_g1~~TRINITY_DN3059_c0_g1_i5.p1  ORF type:complete len:279 (+),score=25.61 TRINITY_DN3059_c0_g1_i5:1153-1989(+)